MLVVSFDPVGAWWLAWVALVPLLLAIRSPVQSTGRLALGAWAGGLVFWLIAVEWVRKSDPGAWPGWLAMALVLSAFWPAFAVLTRLAVRGAGIPLMVAAPAVWVSLEFLRAYFPLNGFHWFYLGYGQYRSTWLIQVSDLTGVWGLSFLVVMVNAWVVNVLTQPLMRPTPKGTRLTGPQTVRLAVVVLSLLGSTIYGAWRTSTANFTKGPRLLLLQSDFPQIFDRPYEPAVLLGTFQQLIAKGLDSSEPPPDLIVWPETMIPFWWVEIDPDLPRAEFERQVREDDPKVAPEAWEERRNRTAEYLHRYTDDVGIPMLLGINSHVFRPEGKRHYNSAVLMMPGENATQAYHKMHLVPFGEYVPLVDLAPWILRLTPFDANYMPNLDPGDRASTFEFGPWTLASVICFEDSVPQVTRRVMTGGEHEPDLLINLSNDGWFRGTVAHQLHLVNSMFRAIEFRVPVARAVNTGISGLIDGNGRVLASLPAAKAAPLTVNVPLDGRTSLYASWGPWLPVLCVVLTVLSAPMAALRRRRARVTGVATVTPADGPSPGELPG